MNGVLDIELIEKIVEWLSDINYRAILADNLGKRAAGTGEWALDDPVVSKWLEGVLRILWGLGMRTSYSSPPCDRF